MKPDIQAVFFDLGDTLVRISFATLAKICKRISEVRGIPIGADDYTRVFLDEWNNRSDPSDTIAVKDIKDNASESECLYWKNFFESLLPDLGVSAYQSDLIEWLINIYTDPTSFVCFEDVYPVLSELQKRGLTLGIISNAFPSAEKILDHLNLRQYFKYIFLSFELRYAKPESEIYKFAAEKVDLPIENILFIDDRWNFVKGAQEANMNALVIERETEAPRKIHTMSLVRRIKSLNELINIVELSNNKKNMYEQKTSASVTTENNQNFCRFSNKTIYHTKVAI